MPPPLPPGTKLGRHEIRSKIGEGGMGEVYLARDEKISRDVAIKVLPPAFSADAERLRRFEQEAQAGDGQWISCYFLDEQIKPTLWRYAIIPASGGRPVRQFDFPGFQYQYVSWTPDGRNLSFIGSPPDPSNIWLQPAEGGEPRKLTDFRSGYIYRHAWSHDGKTLALARSRGTSDVVLMRDEK